MATGGSSPSSPIHRNSAPVSAGDSTSTIDGSSSSSAASTDRAEPGPWCRIPSRWTVMPLLERSARLVEVGPTVTVDDDALEVFTPGHAVVHGIADDGTDDAGGDVAGGQRAVAEVRRQRETVGHDRDRLRRRQGA